MVRALRGFGRRFQNQSWMWQLTFEEHITFPAIAERDIAERTSSADGEGSGHQADSWTLADNREVIHMDGKS